MRKKHASESLSAKGPEISPGGTISSGDGYKRCLGNFYVFFISTSVTFGVSKTALLLLTPTFSSLRFMLLRLLI